MAVLNECAFIAASSGTADFVVASAVIGYYTPEQCTHPPAVDGATYRYRAESADRTQYESGEGVYDFASNTLERATIFQSSNAGAVVSFSAAPIVIVTALAQDLIVKEPTDGSIYIDLNGVNGAFATSSKTVADPSGTENVNTVNFLTGALTVTSTGDVSGVSGFQLGAPAIEEGGGGIGQSTFQGGGWTVANPADWPQGVRGGDFLVITGSCGDSGGLFGANGVSYFITGGRWTITDVQGGSCLADMGAAVVSDRAFVTTQIIGGAFELAAGNATVTGTPSGVTSGGFQLNFGGGYIQVTGEIGGGGGQFFGGNITAADDSDNVSYSGGIIDFAGGTVTGSGGTAIGGRIKLKGAKWNGTTWVGGDIEFTPGTGDTANGLIKLTNLPTSDPGVPGALWIQSGTLKISV